MHRIVLSLALFSVSLAAFADDAAIVRCHEIAFSKAAENRDAEAFQALIDEDARFAGRTVVQRGPAEISAAWKVFFAAGGPSIKWRPRFVEVLQDGTLALTRGPYRMIDKDADGNQVERWGTFNSVWRKQQDGSWRVVFDAGSPGAEPPEAETQALLDEEDDC